MSLYQIKDLNRVRLTAFRIKTERPQKTPAKFTQNLAGATQSESALAPQKTPPIQFARPIAELCEGQKCEIAAARRALQSLSENPMWSELIQKQLTKLDNPTEYLKNYVSNNPSQHRESTQQELKKAENFREELLRLIRTVYKQGGYTPQETQKYADSLLYTGRRDELNSQRWEAITYSVTVGETLYQITHTPSPYYGEQAVCSMSITEAKHAVNLWTVTIEKIDSSGGKEQIFHFAHHAVHSPYGLQDDKKRRDGAVTRAEESIKVVAEQMLRSNPDLLDKAIKANGDGLPIQILSCSLLTPTKSSKEEGMLEDQLNAWEALKNRRIDMTVIDPKTAEKIEIRVKPDIAAFNFGVNEEAILLGRGNDNADKRCNTAAQKKIQQWVQALPKNTANRELIDKLANKLEEFFQYKKHHKDGYRAITLAAKLSKAISAGLMTNCKSGKDRTAVSTAHMVLGTIESDQKTPLSEEQSKTLLAEDMVKNIKIQALNTAYPGNKCAKEITKLFPMPVNRIVSARERALMRGLSFLGENTPPETLDPPKNPKSPQKYRSSFKTCLNHRWEKVCKGEPNTLPPLHL